MGSKPTHYILQNADGYWNIITTQNMALPISVRDDDPYYNSGMKDSFGWQSCLEVASGAKLIVDNGKGSITDFKSNILSISGLEINPR